MLVEDKVNGQASSISNLADAGIQSSPNRIQRTRKVTVQLSERVFEQLEAAIDRPGVGKSVVIETALERLLSPSPPIEELMQEYFDQIRSRLDHFERDMQIIGETVALHARYHLTVMPPLPEPQQREACLRGDERFKVLAEQVDRRVRLARPLMQETIERLNAANVNAPQPGSGESAPLRAEPEPISQRAATELFEVAQDQVPAAAGEGGSNQNFRHLPNSFCSPA